MQVLALTIYGARHENNSDKAGGHATPQDVVHPGHIIIRAHDCLVDEIQREGCGDVHGGGSLEEEEEEYQNQNQK